MSLRDLTSRVTAVSMGVLRPQTKPKTKKENANRWPVGRTKNNAQRTKDEWRRRGVPPVVQWGPSV